MKNQKIIAKKNTTHVILGVCKVIILVLMFSATSIKAQCTPPTVLPFPALEQGQRILITQSNPLWNPMMENATTCRNVVRERVNANPCGDPTSYVSCSGNVCCSTTYQPGVNGGYVYVTVCWSRVSNEILHTSIQ